MPEPNTGCHIWIASVDIAGYGGFCIKDKRIMAHRVAYFLYKGEIPKDFVVDHLCNNPYCVNPLHLEAKTQKENGYRALNSLTTINSLKTHCIRGHEFTEENTFFVKGGGRSCIICTKEYKREWHLKNRVLVGRKPKQTEEERLKKRRTYYEKNKEKLNSQERLRKLKIKNKKQ